MAMAAARSQGAVSEADLWLQHLAVLERALSARKPEARNQIRGEAARLGREISAMMERRNLASRALRWANAADGNEAARTLGCAGLDEQIAARLKQVSDLAALLRGNAMLAKSDDRGGTAEALQRPTAVDPIVMLQGKGRLSEDQVRAAREIAWVYQAITKASQARVSRLCEIDPPAGWHDMPLPARAALVHAKRFLPWAEGLRATAPATLDIVLRVVVLGISVYSVARRHRLGWNGCVVRLADGLERYWRRPETR